MASGGAWQSETFDNGQEVHKARATQAAPMMQQPAAAPPPEIYNPPAGINRPESTSIAIITLSLRIAQLLVSLAALALMASNQYSYRYRSGYSFYYSVDFTRYKAFIGVVAMNAIVCLYAAVQLVLSVVNKATVGVYMFSPTTGNALLTFAFDTILANALMGASGAGANRFSFLQFVRCKSQSMSCDKAQASIALSFFAFALVAATAALYPVRLFRLKTR